MPDLFSPAPALPCHPPASPLRPELIPRTSWGSSLANLLTEASWRALKAPFLERTGGACLLCGVPPTGRRHDAHEIWRYHAPLQPATTGVQELLDIWPLCESCHRMFHLGLAFKQGQLGEMLARLAAMNGWGRHEAQAYYSRAAAEWAARGRYEWVLDLSAVIAFRLALRAGQDGWTVDAGGWLSRGGSRSWGNRTRILGTAYEIGATVRACEAPGGWYAQVRRAA